MTEVMLEVDEGLYRPLRCPRCGNRGESTFSAEAFVLIGGNGIPTLVCAYTEATEAPRVDCHGCDYIGPIEAFRDRHRPGDRMSHSRPRCSADVNEACHPR
jgi:hypothetical protein